MSARPESFRPQHSFEALRVPPQSVEAEQAVIGGLLLAPEALALVGDMLVEADFYRRDHRLIYRGILELDEKKKPYDAVTLGEWFEANALSEQIGGPSYLIELASTTPSAANIRAYAEIVVEKSTLRKLIEAGTEIVNDGFEPAGADALEVVTKANRLIGDITPARGKGGLARPRAALKEWFTGLSARYDSGEWMTGLSTPYTGLDAITFGLQQDDLIIWAARPGMGKTVAGAGAAVHVAEHHGPVATFSLEMSHTQLMQRMIAAHGRIPHDWLRSPNAYEAKHQYCDSDQYWARVSQSIKFLDGLPLLIDETAGLNVDQIIARARRAHREQPLKLILVDHLHIIALPGRSNTAEELGVVSSKLKGLAKELHVPVIALAQLNRGLKDRTDKRPTMTDLRACGAIEQDADEIWFLHREDYYDKKTHLKGVVEMINAKHRNAAAGETVHLRNKFKYMRLDNWEGDLPEPDESQPAPSARGWKRNAPRGRDAAAGVDK